ncbi:Hypothetical predicted protein [Mytilus galloprovincialis]|uniref:Uncharacterized protein n=1 Tax=Mytilus galloprovincialis TaxID=29158 RepID=A0A8B6HAQ9_MYTGA|nr:Hypothetical predicted protein [Mytilus galloprovincialis]
MRAPTSNHRIQPKPEKYDGKSLLEQVDITESDLNSTQLQVELVLDDYDPRETGIGNRIDLEKVQHLDPDTHRIIKDIREINKPSRREVEPNPLLKQENEKESISKYIKELRHRIAHAHELATAGANNARTKQKKAYSMKVRGGDTISVDEDLTFEDERSASHDEIVPEDTFEQNISQTDTDDEDEQVSIRRSTRERRPLLRFTTGEFDMTKSATTTMSDWEKKIQCLKSFADKTTLLQDLQTKAGRTILDILKSSTNAST